MGQNCGYKQMLLGTDRHIVHFPVRNGNLINIVSYIHPKPACRWRHLICVMRRLGLFEIQNITSLAATRAPGRKNVLKLRCYRTSKGSLKIVLTCLAYVVSLILYTSSNLVHLYHKRKLKSHQFGASLLSRNWRQQLMTVLVLLVTLCVVCNSRIIRC